MLVWIVCGALTMSETDLDPVVAYDDDPVHLTVDHPASAFNQGWDAADKGYERGQCPYEADTREGRFWADGWDVRDEDRVGDEQACQHSL